MKQNIRLIFLFFSLACLSCKASRILFPEFDQGDTNWEMRQTDHLYLYFRPSSEASRDIEGLARNFDQAFEFCRDYLKVEYENKIKCYLYSSLEEFQAEQNTEAGGLSAPEFETICLYYPKRDYRTFHHEIVHVLVHWTIGVRRLRFLSEGIAEAIEKYFKRNGEDRLWVHAVSSDLLENDRLYSIDQLADNGFFERIRKLEFSGQDTTPHLYDQCASLVRFLADRHGIDRFKSFYSKAGEDNYRDIFRHVNPENIDAFEEAWHEFLRNH
jgi:hypothetical protein